MVVFIGNKYGFTALLSIQPPAHGEERLLLDGGVEFATDARDGKGVKL